MCAGLAPEKIHFLDEGGFKVEQDDVGNLLRPETVESIYYMWRLTGEQRYREWGWEIFQAFQENAKGDVGYHSLKVNMTFPHSHSQGSIPSSSEPMGLTRWLCCSTCMLARESKCPDTEVS